MFGKEFNRIYFYISFIFNNFVLIIIDLYAFVDYFIEGEGFIS